MEIRPSPSALRAAIKAGRTTEAAAVLGSLTPGRRAELFVQLRPAHQKAILDVVAPELAAQLLADSDSRRVADAFAAMDATAKSKILPLIPPDHLADLLLHQQAAAQTLDLLEPALREEVRKLLAFAPDTAGGIMTPRYLSVPEVVTVGRALELLRESPGAEGPSYVYVVDAAGRLAGVVPLRRLVTAGARTDVGSLMVRNVVRLKSDLPRADIISVFGEHRYVSLPVVDDKDRLIGIVTFDDVMALMREGERQVLQGLTGIDPRDALKETFAATRGRIPWVLVTILGGLGCAVVGGFFQKTLSELVVLALFVPIVTALGESIGAQTTSIVLSTFAGGGMTTAELTRFAIKEFLVGLLVGLFSGVIVSLASLFWHGNPRIGLLIGGAVFVSVAWTALLAVFIPGLMRRFKVNPEIASGPLVLALSDFSTLFVYFGGAAMFSHALK